TTTTIQPQYNHNTTTTPIHSKHIFKKYHPSSFYVSFPLPYKINILTPHIPQTNAVHFPVTHDISHILFLFPY
ncbi:hypothetical protein, partial [Escherichia coli]|uniref:hypothetical protein n=1 Tax=Escherichia coli TaxID=562 RepID=UPI001F282FFB